MVKHDAIVVGAGHNGLVAATLLARAGKRVLVLEQQPRTGGAAVSERVFSGHDARLSRYSYLVSLFPRELLHALAPRIELTRRPTASYPEQRGVQALYHLTDTIARAVFPTMLQRLPTHAELKQRVNDDDAWESIFERPLSELLTATIDDDLQRGIAATDALIGTFASLEDPSLQQNRCFLYHVIGGSWDVPVGGMGALTMALLDAALAAGVDIRTSTEVTAIDSDGATAIVRCAQREYAATHLLAAIAPATLARLQSDPAPAPAPEGSQLKLNLLLGRLPRLADGTRPELAFAGTFHVNESYSQLQTAYLQAAAGQIPDPVPCEAYCHSLTDPTILGPELRAQGAQTLTVFALHLPARLFRDDPNAKQQAVAATLRSINSVLAEPIEACLLQDADGRPCLEAHTPIELEHELGLPAGNIFHRDLQWPYAEDGDRGAWGVETERPNVWLAGAGARRGGGVSGIPGHNAAQTVLAALRR